MESQDEKMEVLTIEGLDIALDSNIVSKKIADHIRRGSYEIGEIVAASKIVDETDTVLDLGAGLGLVAAAASIRGKAKRVICVEANPFLIPIIKNTLNLNGARNVAIISGTVSADAVPDKTFFLHKDFWASSTSDAHRRFEKKITVPNYNFQKLVDRFDPTVLIMDIEGAEQQLFDVFSFRNIKCIMMEFHTKLYGDAERQRITNLILDAGYEIDEAFTKGSVVTFRRAKREFALEKELPKKTRVDFPLPDHSIENPKTVIVTCMKNEGPFILEWIAYHKAIGIHDFVIFSNDCTDGTDKLLDHLDEIGLVTHLENPAVLMQSTYFQPSALKYAGRMPLIRRADYVISMDVDEFINIRVGEGKFTDLLQEVGPFHALSMSHLNFSHSGRFDYEDHFLIEHCLRHESHVPGRRRAHRGIKTIIHPMSAFTRMTNHRPLVAAENAEKLIWLDGSGQDIREMMLPVEVKGIDCRGRYDIVTLNHYPIRSVQSYLVKKDRGDVVIKRKSVDRSYFKTYSRGGHQEDWIAPRVPQTGEMYRELMENPKTAALHHYCVGQHQKRYQEIENDPGIVELRDWIVENYFNDDASEA